MIDKHKFRQHCLAYREQLSSVRYDELSKIIIENLCSKVNLLDYSTIHCYAAITKNREINTLPLLKILVEKEARIVLPVSDFEHIEMQNIPIHDMKDLKENRWGILEPISGPEIKNEEIELAIIPMVGGDPRCNRIGYGKGFYDRFLANVDALKIGLCYQQCIAPEPVKTSDHDIPLDMIITEKKTYERSQSIH